MPSVGRNRRVRPVGLFCGFRVLAEKRLPSQEAQCLHPWTSFVLLPRVCGSTGTYSYTGSAFTNTQGLAPGWNCTCPAQGPDSLPAVHLFAQGLSFDPQCSSL